MASPVLSPTYAAMAIDLDGASIAMADHGSNCWVWQPEGQGATTAVDLDDATVQALDFDPVSHRLALGCADGAVWLWGDRGAVRLASGSGSAIRSIRWMGHDAVVAATQDGRARGYVASDGRIWSDFDTADPNSGFGRAIRSTAIDSSTRQLVTGNQGGRVAVWDMASGRLLRELQGHGGWIGTLSVSPDGAGVAAGNRDGIVTVWGTQGSTRTEFKAHVEAVRASDFDPRRGYLATGGNDRLVRVWNWRTQTLVAELAGLNGWVIDVRFMPNGDVVAGDADGVLTRWELPSGRILSRSRFVDPRLEMPERSDDRQNSSWQLIANQYDWSSLRCGCPRGARHVPEDFARLVEAQNEDDASGDGLVDDVETQSMLFEAAVPVAAMIVAALRDGSISAPARLRMFRLLNSLVNGESSFIEAELGRPSLEDECRSAAIDCVELCRQEIAKPTAPGAADHAQEILEAYDIFE
ncbi:WD40 repeat domain-containing protein [Krasilnikovia sp. MM14-A1004]|uniref:WD40 repeat domain-containing protein n=1 Tax=Krasilnikovia sp. MM14-A1004 TaxID=3373541 RepID=UPI00399CA9B3